MNPDVIFGAERVYEDTVLPAKIGDADLYQKAVVYEIPGLGCIVDLYYHLNYLKVKRLINANTTKFKETGYKSRVFSSPNFAISFLRKRGIFNIELHLEGTGISLQE